MRESVRESVRGSVRKSVRAPALEEDGKKTIFGKRKSLFGALTSPQGTGLGGTWQKNDFRQAKITFWSLYPSTRHQLWRMMVNTIFGQRKSLFGALTPPQGTGPGGRWLKTIFGKRKSLFGALALPQGTSPGGRW